MARRSFAPGRTSAALRRLVVIGLAATILHGAGCSEDKPATAPIAKGAAARAAPLTWAEAVVLNSRACALMDRQFIAEATDIWRDMTVRAPLCATGWINFGIALLNVQKNDPKEREANHAECERVLRHAVTLDPASPWAVYTLGVLLRYLGRVDDAFPYFEKALALDPSDADANYSFGQALATRKEYAKAAEHLRIAIRHHSHFQGAWYVLSGVLARLGAAEERAQALAMDDLFRSQPNLYIGKKLEEKYNFMGRYCCVIRDVPPFGDAPPAKPAPAEFAFASRAPAGTPATAGGMPLPWGKVLKAGGSIRAFLEKEVVPALGPGLARADIDGDGVAEVWVGNGTGVGRLLKRTEAGWVDVTVERGLQAPVVAIGATFGDVNHDGHRDLFVFGAGKNVLFMNDGKGGFRADDSLNGPDDQVTLSALVLDADHDGDLDILVAGFLALPGADAVAAADMEFPRDFPGAPNRLFNNDRPTIFESGAPAPAKAFTDIGERTGLAAGGQRTAAFVAADVDRDGDVDLLEINDGAPNRLLSNDRIWRYHDVAAEWRADDAGPAYGGFAADLDQDGFPDVVLVRGPGASAVLLANVGGRGFQPRSLTEVFGAADAAGVFGAGDFDNDGRPDLVAGSPDGNRLTLARGAASGPTPAGSAALGEGVRCRAALPVDLDGDGRLDILASTAGGGLIEVINGTPGGNRRIGIELRGKEGFSPAESWSNTFGLGAFVEVAAGPLKVHADTVAVVGPLACGDGSIHVGLGGAERAEYARIIWPDLVIQSEMDLEAGKTHVIEEVNRKPSSCPVVFKYAGRGDEFEFVTDFLGVGGLGFFVEPGSYAPPDATEVVRLGAIPEKDGRLELRVTEPMEEVSYLDELKLIAIDHDDGVEVHADERLATSEPSPTGRPIAFRHRVRPTRALTRHGLDTTDDVTRQDRIYQQGMVRDRRFIGYLTEEQWLSLEFDRQTLEARRAETAAAPRLWLFVDGWVEYPYSHVNFACWQAGVRSCSFSIDRRLDDGSWSECMKEVGYPGGMSRTMAIEVTDVLGAGGDALRLRTNLEVGVDDVWLAWELPQAAMVVTEVSFDVAETRMLGYPREGTTDGKMPKPYDYQTIDATFEWKTMSGDYTRFGDVRELLEHADDRYVILNHGEEIALSVKSAALPVLEAGRRRTFFLKADGWCKDMDPYTAAPDTVGPLPFHAMPNYTADILERHPTTGDASWHRLWNSRRIEGTWKRAAKDR